MIRFVYPNVNASEQFVGCGRYVTTSPDDSRLINGYTIANPNVGHLSKITTAASLLAKESFDSEQEVYEYKDDPASPYLGDSMGLAYLLALIQRSRTTIWGQNSRSLDIWCTGTIDVTGGMPILTNVYRNLFDIKLNAFLADEKDPLFIVPVANIEPKHRQLCRDHSVRVISLEQFATSLGQGINDRKSILQVHGDELEVLVKAIFAPPSRERGATLALPKKPLHEDEPESEHDELPEHLHAGLNELQSTLLLFSKKAVVNDEVVVEFDTVGVKLLNLLESFPGHFDEFHELITEYQHFAENMFSAISDQEYRRVLAVRFGKLEQCIENLAGEFKYGEGFLTKELSGSFVDSPYSFYKVDFDELETEYGVKKLISGDEIHESEGIDWLLKTGFVEAEKRLQRIADLGSLNQVFDVLWKRFPRILLYYHETFWKLVKYMLMKNPLRWKLRFHALKILLKRSLTANQASEILQNFVPSEQQILSAFLVLHSKRECRKFAMEALPSDSRWDILLCSSIPWLIIRELVEKSCQDSSDSYIKALFLLLRPRLLVVNSPLAIGQAYQIISVFYHVPVFLQETFFQALIGLHKNLAGKVQSYPITGVLEDEIRQVFQAFCTQSQLRDVDITEMTHIPLPIQRKLAHDGYLPKYFICNIRDVIALETVPHVERRRDVIKFFRLRRINTRALEKLASNKHIMREYRNRSVFCHNPKANSVLIRTYLSTLTRRDIKDISRDRNVSVYARELATKYLSRYK